MAEIAPQPADANRPQPEDNFLKGVNLYLIGMMGSGKTTLGRIVAKQLGYRFFDTDVLVEQAAGQSVSEIFTESGEAIFRQLETQVLGRLATYTRLAIATGGGIVLEQKNWSYLHHGVVVWLDAPLDLLYTRLQGSTTRPLLQHEDLQPKLKTLLEQRQHLYALADVRVLIRPEESANRAATRVLEAVRQTLKPAVAPPVSLERLSGNVVDSKDGDR
jgi:shikimate kinase